MHIDILKKYGRRVIGGVDKQDILDAIYLTNNGTLRYADGQLYFRKTNTPVVFHKCVNKYFKPVESYYRLDKASCKLIRMGLGLTNLASRHSEPNCRDCFTGCIRLNCEMLPSAKKKSIVNCDF